MDRYEYTVIAAPDRGSRAKSAKTPTDRYALALAEVLNDMAEHGWEYQRAETLPSEERSGIASRQTLWHNVLIFRREIGGVAEAVPATAAAGPVTAPVATEAPAEPAKAPATDPAPAKAEPTPPATPASQRAADTPPLRRSAEQAPAPTTTPPRLGPAAR